MIWSSIINFVLGLIIWLVSLLPEISAADTANIANITSAFGSIRGFFSGINFWFPVDDLFTVLASAIFITLGVSLFHTLRWIASNLSAGVLK